MARMSWRSATRAFVLVLALARSADAQDARDLSEAPDTWGSGRAASGTATTAPSPTRALPAQPPQQARTPEDVSSRVAEPLHYTLEGIRVRGNTRTLDRVVLRYLPFAPGDVINVDDPALTLAKYRLLTTGFFKDVQFALEKGSQRGRVVLVVQVFERNTIIVNDLWLGLSADADTQGNRRPLTAYGGVDVAETNLLGTGITLGSAIGIAQDQLALRVRFLDPAALGGHWMTSGTLLFNDARDFFGNAKVLYVDPQQLTRTTDYAVVRYKRFGGAAGIGRDLSIASQLWLHYRLEAVDASFPLQASHHRGEDNVEPIDFQILRGRSILSTLRGSFQLDTRDHPFLPTRGWFATITSELGLGPFGSDYSFQRFDVQASHWWALPFKGHVLRLNAFAGAIVGTPPFFESYYVGDFSDFLPARVLGVNFDRRPPPNFLGTQIVEVRYGTYAAKLSGEYRIPLYRGHRSVFGIDLFASAGVYAVASDREISDPPPDYSGLSLIPVDLTANVGFRMDTSAGGFVFAFSNVLGFIPVHGEGPAGE